MLAVMLVIAVLTTGSVLIGLWAYRVVRREARQRAIKRQLRDILRRNAVIDTHELWQRKVK